MRDSPHTRTRRGKIKAAWSRHSFNFKKVLRCLARPEMNRRTRLISAPGLPSRIFNSQWGGLVECQEHCECLNSSSFLKSKDSGVSFLQTAQWGEPFQPWWGVMAWNNIPSGPQIEIRNCEIVSSLFNLRCQNDFARVDPLQFCRRFRTRRQKHASFAQAASQRWLADSSVTDYRTHFSHRCCWAAVLRLSCVPFCLSFRQFALSSGLLLKNPSFCFSTDWNPALLTCRHHTIFPYCTLLTNYGLKPSSTRETEVIMRVRNIVTSLKVYIRLSQTCDRSYRNMKLIHLFMYVFFIV